MIFSTGLTNEEIGELNEIRDSYASGDFYRGADKMSRLNERKLRLFFYKHLRILYGERWVTNQKTRQAFASYVANNISKDRNKGFSVGRNEF